MSLHKQATRPKILVSQPSFGEIKEQEEAKINNSGLLQVKKDR